MKMEGAVLSVTSNNNRFRTHLKNAASAICARTLPKQRRNDPAATSSSRHHTYPRATPPKRASISCRMEPLMCPVPHHATAYDSPEPVTCALTDTHTTKKSNKLKLKGTLAREVTSAWECRVGPADHPASADRVQSLFNDIELYPTKTQVPTSLKTPLIDFRPEIGSNRNLTLADQSNVTHNKITKRMSNANFRGFTNAQTLKQPD
ncbi:hypothetical protein O3G_MSEX008260 [Manduca sexta]|uniref:Uncharacterized protein n=1 Tax=Manduca sexta TaxID=7130 RepID=A0A921ZA53_MANSE|nr:hypothetical protein O3G_MSEX008260 [Manduca sexta]